MPPGSLTAAIEQASALLASDAAAAERQARGVLVQAPADPRALLILGSALRRQGRFAAARSILDPLAGAHPQAALTQYELGVTLAALGDPAEGMAVLRRAVAIRRDLPEAWKALGDLLFAAGDARAAETAFREHVRASVRDPRLAPAADALFAGDAALAAERLRIHLDAWPADTAALQMLGQAAAQLGDLDQAEARLAACLSIDPGLDGARFDLADVLFRQQRATAALALVEELLARDPGDPAYRNLKAACLGMIGEYDAAIALYETLLADYPNHPRLWLNQGHALRTVGRRAEAVAAYSRSIALAGGFGDAYWSLANLKTSAISAELEAAMARELQRPDIVADDRLHLHYALGKALEDRGDPASAFEHYSQGARQRREDLRYDPDDATALMRRSKALFTRDFFATRAGAGSPSNAPIFIVGLPRSGSTLVEQILASHSQVEGTMELPDIGLIARDLIRGEGGGEAARYPQLLAGLETARLAELGEAFLARTQVQRKLGRPFFIDKMPNNFHHIGLIQLILPNARIIDARRHPLGSGFSAFKQHFSYGHAFSYDLTDLGRYYRDYVELMAHVDRVLPGRVHRVIYEDLVEHTEREVVRLLAHCGLPFEAPCLAFHENARAVRTVSSEQVRRPIYREGLDQWRAYEPWLGPLKAALGPALEAWRG
jgi:tetratricopeptide (TPR) repeat protein